MLELYLTAYDTRVPTYWREDWYRNVAGDSSPGDLLEH